MPVNTLSMPICRISIHSGEELYSITPNVEENPNSRVLSITTSKTLNSPAGSFTIVLAGSGLFGKIGSQNIVVIELGRKNQIADTIMVGLIDEVRLSRTVGSNNQKELRTVINGRDFGKVFLKAFIKWLPVLGTDKFPLEALTSSDGQLMQMLKFYTRSEQQQGSPAMIIQQAIDSVLHAVMGFNIKYWRDNKLQDIGLKELVRYRLGKTNFILDVWTSMGSYEGALWNFMTSVENKPFFELFIDTIDDNETKYVGDMLKQSKVERDSYKSGDFSATFGEDNAKIILYLRETPFDEDNWKDLRTVFIDDSQILSEDLGYGDHENYNMFLVNPKMTILGEDIYRSYVRPEYDAENVKKYGISFMERSVDGVFAKDDGSLDVGMTETGKTLTKKLKSWYEKNLTYLNGSIKLQGLGGARVGMKLINLDTGYEYYIEGVSQNFDVFSSWSTSLQVTRGQKISKITKTDKEVVILPDKNQPQTAEKKSIPEPTYYTVVKGDSLWKIAHRFYNNGLLYQKIYDANKDIIKNKDLIYPGQKFIIPGK